MDTFSHAAWGYAVLRGARKGTRAGDSQRRIRWWGAALAGAAPDLLFAIPLAVQRMLGLGTPPPAVSPGPDIWRADGPPMPQYLLEAYDRYYVKSHSLVLLACACAILWASGRRRWLWLAVPYALHIALDVPTHERFQTQPFWPLWSWRMQGLAWGDPRIFFPNLAVLTGVYLWLWKTRRI
ncbi:MAG TPA: metal-dependent hydrolase [Vicinamibacterales bacterium]|nr:metal-dependent hydrolase [Vicinamibacterales bacterium]